MGLNADAAPPEQRQPLLSIVMPTRNQCQFIEASVASALAQAEGLGGPLEIVVTDGASTDGTPELLQRLAQAHPGVLRWISEPDRGPADAVNKAVALARAPLVGWLNSDDLYTPGAGARAVAALQARPDWVMVYGEGEHVDLHTAPLGRYPTHPPDRPLARWSDGCPICQPSAFFRREVFLALGGLDLSLRTAFDFEFWLRLFRAHPGRIGFLPQVQALSRLHDEGITLRMRETVAMEGMAVLHRHLGSAPGHWLLTYASEALRDCPFDADPAALRRRLDELVVQATPWIGAAGVELVRRGLRHHRGWIVARPGFAADVLADGWTPAAMSMRVLQPAPPCPRLRLWGRHVAEGAGTLHLSLETAAGDQVWQGQVTRRGSFERMVALPPAEPGSRQSLILRSSPPYVPARTRSGNHDHRELGFMLDAVELCTR